MKDAVVGVGSLDDLPWRVSGVGQRDNLFRNLREPVVQVPVLPVSFRHPPVVFRVLLDTLQTLLLQRFADMHPVLQNEHAVISQGFLEHINAPDPELKLILVNALEYAIEQQGRIPPAQEKPDLSPWWQAHPVSPHFRTHVLCLDPGLKAMRVEPTCIHPLVEHVDAFRFARAADTGKIDHHGRPGLLPQPLLLHQQAVPQLRLAILEIAIGQRLAKLSSLEHQFPMGVLGTETRKFVTGRLPS